jgi:thioredoxin-like negative regulator of GroEL
LLQLVTANMGELAEAEGDLEQAERLYKQALEQAEAPGEDDRDYDYISRWNARLAAIVQAQGKLDEAATCVSRAWRVAHSIRSMPCLAQALVALGNIRIAQAGLLEKQTLGLGKGLPRVVADKLARRLRLLDHARVDLERVKALGRQVDVETTIRGRLALAHVSFLQGRREEAYTQLRQIILDAQKHELAQVVLRARELLAQVNG